MKMFSCHRRLSSSLKSTFSGEGVQMHPGRRIKFLTIFSRSRFCSSRWVCLTCWLRHLRGVDGAAEALMKAVQDPDRLGVRVWRRFSHATCVLPSVPEKRCFLGPVCFCVVRRDGDAAVSRPELPSFQFISLSVAVWQRRAKCHGSGSERKEEKGVGLQAGGGLFTLLSVTLRWLVS